jgi:hypothetical protein
LPAEKMDNLIKKMDNLTKSIRHPARGKKYDSKLCINAQIALIPAKIFLVIKMKNINGSNEFSPFLILKQIVMYLFVASIKKGASCFTRRRRPP